MPLPSSHKAGLHVGRQMQVELSEIPFAGGLPRAFHLPFRQAIPCRERIDAFPAHAC
jgi:hypothetical protein